MLLAVAVALLVVQSVGAFLVYRAQSERQEAGLVHSVAFRLIAEIRGREFLDFIEQRSPPHMRDHPPRFMLERAAASPLRPGEPRLTRAENDLARILEDQGLGTAEIIIFKRRAADDRVSIIRTMRGSHSFDENGQDRASRHVMIAGVRFKDGKDWLIARIPVRWDQWDIVGPLLLQTVVIYLVLVAAVAIIMRRITRPLAALTSQVESFAKTRSAGCQIEPEGPDDICRLIDAHNAMEARISALLDEKDVMLGAIGHDLKTPLAALRVRIEAVEDDTERSKMAATIEDIVRALDDILSLARVGRSKETPEKTELSALIASLVEEYEDMGSPVNLDRTDRIVLAVQPTFLRRAVRNLVGNALRYGGSARVSLLREGNAAQIVVEDDGPGIPEDEIDAMMDPFTRGDPSRNSATGGTGLGLTLARAIADQHGGSLRLVNRLSSNGKTEGLSAILSLPIT